MIRSSSGRGLLFVTNKLADGPWFGRWGVNYIYGSSGVLRALETIGLVEGCRLPGRGQLAALGAKSRWRLRRIDSFLLRSCAQRKREEHGLADGLGRDRLARGRPGRRILPLSGQLHGWWRTKTKTAHGTKRNLPAPVSLRVLFEISPISKRLPTLRAWRAMTICARDGAGSSACRFLPEELQNSQRNTDVSNASFPGCKSPLRRFATGSSPFVATNAACSRRLTELSGARIGRASDGIPLLHEDACDRRDRIRGQPRGAATCRRGPFRSRAGAAHEQS